MSATAQEKIFQALNDAKFCTAEGIQPAILLNQNINPYLVTDVARCSVGEPGSASHDKFSKMLNDGWKLFRIQTEFCSVSGHLTAAYFAKMGPI